MMNEITVTNDDINDQLDHCRRSQRKGSVYHGMSFEDGVEAAILWLTSQTDDLPVAREDLYTED